MIKTLEVGALRVTNWLRIVELSGQTKFVLESRGDKCGRVNTIGFSLLSLGVWVFFCSHRNIESL